MTTKRNAKDNLLFLKKILFTFLIVAMYFSFAYSSRIFAFLIVAKDDAMYYST